MRHEAAALMHGWAEEIRADSLDMDNGSYPPYAVLNDCRMLRTWKTGEIVSKPAAAGGGGAKLDARWSDLIERALGLIEPR